MMTMELEHVQGPRARFWARPSPCIYLQSLEKATAVTIARVTDHRLQYQPLLHVFNRNNALDFYGEGTL